MSQFNYISFVYFSLPAFISISPKHRHISLPTPKHKFYSYLFLLQHHDIYVILVSFILPLPSIIMAIRNYAFYGVNMSNLLSSTQLFVVHWKSIPIDSFYAFHTSQFISAKNNQYVRDCYTPVS